MHVLVLGARPEILAAVRGLGHEVSMVYEPWEADAVPSWLAGSVCVDSYFNLEALLGVLANRGWRDGRFGAVVTAEEFAVTSAAVLAELLGARGMAVDTALRFRDKAVQKAAVAAAGIPVAASRHVDDLARLATDDDPARGLGYPVVLKPVAGAATEATVRAVSAAELRVAAKELLARHPERRNYLLEEFVPGVEWHIDGYVSGGELRHAAVSRYAAPLLDIRDGVMVASVLFDPRRDAEEVARGTDLTRRALAALGATDLVFHLECFDTGAELVFSECGARLGGGMVGQTVLAAHGVDLAYASVAVHTGDPLPAPMPEVDRESFGWVCLPTRPGAVNHVTEQDLLRLPGIRAARLEVPAGATMPDTRTDSATRLGVAVVSAPDRVACRALVDQTVRAVTDLHR